MVYGLHWDRDVCVRRSASGFSMKRQIELGSDDSDHGLAVLCLYFLKRFGCGFFDRRHKNFEISGGGGVGLSIYGGIFVHKSLFFWRE